MKKFKKITCLLLAGVMVLGMAACGGGTTTETKAPEETKTPDPAPVEVTYVREDDGVVYEQVLGEYEALMAKAAEAGSVSERFVIMAQAEANLLASCTFIPTTTNGGTFAISRIAPRTAPYVQWGSDSSRMHTVVISEDFIGPDERDELMAIWEKACVGEAEYTSETVIKWLADHGHGVKKEYGTTFSTLPATIDWLNTSSAADTEITVNCVDGLVEYDNKNVMQPSLAESWEISEDGLTYTFHIRDGAAWYTSEGQKYADVTANDFVAGFHHMLDTAAGLEWLVEGIVAGAGEYLEGGAWDDVGYKAPDDKTLVITLCQPTSYFMTMLTYSCFLPICASFYESHGGVYGIEEYAAASAANTINYGLNTDVSSQVYCGPYLLQKMVNNSEIVCVRNTKYWNDATTTLDTLKWVYDDSANLTAFYNDVVAGSYYGCSLGTAEIGALAKADGNWDKYCYTTDTGSTTYFGGLNVNRGTFVLANGGCASTKTEQEKIDTVTALKNQNFRWAIAFAWDQVAYNAVSRGDNALTNLRNMYTAPLFVSLEEDVTDANGKTWPAGTFYGEMVQYYCDQLDLGITVADGQNGWYNPTKAVEKLNAAVAELGDSVTYPIQIDVVYYSASDTQTAQLAVVKSSIEGVLGADKVQINMVEATTTDDFYASGYRAASGEAGNFDLFYGSGWGPDYGDPSTYLDTFKGYGAGYMTKVIGLF